MWTFGLGCKFNLVATQTRITGGCVTDNIVLVAPNLPRIRLQIYFHKGCDYFHRPVQFDKRPCLCNLIRLCHFLVSNTTKWHGWMAKFKNEKNAGKFLVKSGSLTKCFWNIFLIRGCSQSHALLSNPWISGQIEGT